MKLKKKMKNKKKQIKQNTFFQIKSMFWALFFLVVINYFKNYMLIFVNFLLPSLILLIFWFIFVNGSLSLDKEYIIILLPGLASSSVFSVGLVSFSSVVSSWKKSIIFKKLKASRVPNYYLPFALFLFYIVISLLSFWFVYLNAWLLQKEDVEQIFNKMEHLKFWIGIISSILISCLIGLLVGFVSYNESTSLSIGMSLMLLNAFLLGCYILPSFVISSRVLRLTSVALPHYSSIKLIQLSWFKEIKVSQLGNIKMIELLPDSKVFGIAVAYERYIEFSKLKFNWEIYSTISLWIVFLTSFNIFLFKFKKNK